MVGQTITNRMYGEQKEYRQELLDIDVVEVRNLDRRWCGKTGPHEIHTWGHVHDTNVEGATEMYECYGIPNG